MVLLKIMKKPIKQKTCKICKEKFTPFQPLQSVCTNNGYACAREFANRQREKQIKKEKKEFNAETRRMKEKIKTRKQWAEEAQAAFNKFIRLRDARDPCISCGTTDQNIQYCAGHYKTRGAYPELRYEELNVHKQCNKNCNLHLSGNIINYRPRLIEKIGIDKVEWLEGHHEPKKYTIDDLKRLKATYNKKAKEIVNK